MKKQYLLLVFVILSFGIQGQEIDEKDIPKYEKAFDYIVNDTIDIKEVYVSAYISELNIAWYYYSLQDICEHKQNDTCEHYQTIDSLFWHIYTPNYPRLFFDSQIIEDMFYENNSKIKINITKKKPFGMDVSSPLRKQEEKKPTEVNMLFFSGIRENFFSVELFTNVNPRSRLLSEIRPCSLCFPYETVYFYLFHFTEGGEIENLYKAELIYN